jgi:hypothetical protein
MSPIEPMSRLYATVAPYIARPLAFYPRTPADGEMSCDDFLTSLSGRYWAILFALSDSSTPGIIRCISNINLPITNHDALTC